MSDSRRLTRATGAPVPPVRTTRREFLVAGILLGATVVACGPASTQSTSVSATPSAGSMTPRRGGVLRVGMLGGANDIVDGQYIVAKPDIARLVTGWEPLATYDEQFRPVVGGGLAEEITSVSPDEYVIRVRSDVEFHNGKTLGADDVVYSFRRAIDPTLGINPPLSKLLASRGVTAIDSRTVRVRLDRPDVTFLDTLALYAFGMVPEGYSRDDPEQVGTGPFRLESFTPGQVSRHVRHANYWQSDRPYLDEVEIIDFAESTALVNALRSNQLDCIVDVPFALANALGDEDQLQLLESQGGAWLALTMAVDQPPFDDVRVRRAFRLLADRPEMVQRVLAGHGRIANDMYAPLDPCSPRDLPQRERDLASAQGLLAEAGYEDLEIDLYAPTDVRGLADLAAVFADHARDAGVTVNVRLLPGAEYWGEDYCRRTFATGFWGTRSYLPQVPLSSLRDAVHPETHWPPADSDFAATFERALATADDGARCEIIRRMQTEEYESGGYLIPFFVNLVDAHRVGVNGLVARANVINLDHYGGGFANVWLD